MSTVMRFGIRGLVLVGAVVALGLGAAQAGVGAAAAPKWIVFSAHPDNERATQPQQLFRVASTGGDPEQITTGRLIATEPSFSPDGKTIVFQRLGSGLFRMNVDGTGLKRLTSHARDAYPVFSSDGKKIAFIRLRGTDWRLHVMSATGAGERLLPQALPAGRPTWSRDGKSVYAAAAADLYRFDSRTGAIRQTYGVHLDIQTMQTLTVSPNFRTVAYIGPRVSTGPDDCGEGPCPQYGLYLANIGKPHKPRKIFNDASPAGWSPDGKSLAFISRGALQIYDVATGRRTLISTAERIAEGDSSPAWPPK
jgi:Tol biopolymer transport system component